MLREAPVIIRHSLIVGMKNYSTQKDVAKMKDLTTSHDDAKRMKNYLKDKLDWPLPTILTDNSS